MHYRAFLHPLHVNCLQAKQRKNVSSGWFGLSNIKKNAQLLRLARRTSDGGNGNHSVSLPIILIKIKVDQMLPFSYISSLLVSIL